MINPTTAPPMDGTGARGRSSTLVKMRGHAAQGSWLNDAGSPNPPPSSGSSVRNVRKRHSFFGGSSVDVSSARYTTAQHSTTSNEAGTQIHYVPRPPTAMSVDTSTRRKVEPLESIRNSIFGRKKPAAPSLRDRGDSNALPSSRSGRSSPEAQQWSREHFRSEEEFYRYQRKQKISPPFNFEHVTHTGKAQLPALDTVDEKDLPAQFWSISAYQRPRRHLNGIKAEDLHQRYPQSGSPWSSPNSRPTSPLPTLTIPEEPARDQPHIPTPTSAISPLDDAMFDEVGDTCFDLGKTSNSMVQPARRKFKYPKRYSSLGALNELHEQTESMAQDPATFYDSNSSSEIEVAGYDSPHDVQTPPENAEVLGSFPLPPRRPRPEGIEYRSTQPLPSIPVQKPTRKSLQGSLRSVYRNRSSVTSIITTPVKKPISPKSKRSSCSSHSARKSMALSSPSDRRRPGALSDTTWEDDVDFCYDQEAEATCDFNWDFSQTCKLPRNGSGDWPSASSYHGTSPTVSNESSSSLKYQNSNGTIAERHRSQLANQHKRGSSVGHRGFLAARKNSSADLVSQANLIPAPINVTRNSTQVSILSPIFSVTGADDDTPKTPLTPGTLQFTGVNTEYLSDPESYRNSDGSRHRKSSSYDSYESSAKPPAANVYQARDVTRWSVASASSLPDLLHSRPKSKLSFSKTVISRPLESLPQSPGIKEAGLEIYESSIKPRSSQIELVRNTFAAPPPQQHPGDRAVVQAAGGAAKTAPRSRAGTPARFSRVVQPASESVPESSRAGPGWI